METLETRDVEFTYGRPSNPTTRALETALAKLEGGARTFLTPSGLSAIAVTLLSFAEAGGHMLISDSVYMPTQRFAGRVLKRMGVNVEYYDPLIDAGIAKLLRQNTKLVFTELPGSQTFEIQDIPAICRVARGAGVPVAIDNTWGTPLYFRAFEHGVNISIQSATKYIVGHADALLGAVTCDEAAARAVAATPRGDGPLRGQRRLLPRPARLAHAGGAHGAALAIGPCHRCLAARPSRSRASASPCPARRARPRALGRDFRGAAGLFSIVLKPCPKKAVHRMLNALEIFGMGYSWGGFESLIVPFDFSAARTATAWKPEGPALRLHIGLEDVDDLKRDLERGFAALARGDAK